MTSPCEAVASGTGPLGFYFRVLRYEPAQGEVGEKTIGAFAPHRINRCLCWCEARALVSELPSTMSLRAFEAAARHLSFTRAATELDMTQGAVSQHIKNLEELVGVKLFARERKTIQLTEAGEEYLVSARSVITELLVATDRAIERQRGDILTVACLGSYLIKCLVPNLRSFIKEHPGIGVRLRTLERVVPTSTVTSDCDVSI